MKLESLTETLTDRIHLNMKVIVLIGPPCSGKTTLGRRLAEILSGIYLDQDQFSGNKKKYLNAIRTTKSDVLILGKCHHTMDSITESLNGTDPSAERYFFNFMNTSTNMKPTLYERQMARDPSKLSTMKMVIGRIINEYDNRIDDISVRLDYKASVEDNVATCLKITIDNNSNS